MQSVSTDLLGQGRALVFCFWQAIILHPVAVALKPVGADLLDQPLIPLRILKVDIDNVREAS